MIKINPPLQRLWGGTQQLQLWRSAKKTGEMSWCLAEFLQHCNWAQLSVESQAAAVTSALLFHCLLLIVPHTEVNRIKAKQDSGSGSALQGLWGSELWITIWVSRKTNIVWVVVGSSCLLAAGFQCCAIECPQYCQPHFSTGAWLASGNLLNQILLLKAECSLFTVLLLGETAWLPSFFLVNVCTLWWQKKKEFSSWMSERG